MQASEDGCQKAENWIEGRESFTHINTNIEL